MEVIKEVIPFAIGLAVPLPLRALMRPGWSSQLRIVVSLLAALACGVVIAATMGELGGDLPEALVSILIDASMVYTASQLAQRLFWKPMLQPGASARKAAPRQ